VFFLERKNQRTFEFLLPGVGPTPGVLAGAAWFAPESQKFFGSFFSKKNNLP
jgi:hypothetical protein